MERSRDHSPPLNASDPLAHVPGMGLAITVALDRDALHIVELTLVPQGHQCKPTCWLLVHGIPATASLPLALQRLRAAAEEAAPVAGSSVALATSAALGGSSSLTPSVASVLVGYVMSEVHAYCLLIHCQDTVVAERVRRQLEKETAPGTAAPVDFVEPEGWDSTRELSAGLPAASLASSPAGFTLSTGTAQREKVSLEQLVLSCCITAPGSTFRPPQSSDDALHTGPSPRSPAGLRSRGGNPHAMSPHLLPFSHAVPPALHEDCSICQTDPLYTRPVVITLCHHAFHIDCYSKLVEGTSDCPLCRFSLGDLQKDAKCAVCGTFEDLWVCLVCGFTGCGRARRHHLEQHSQDMNHSCAVQASTGRIWDAAAGLFLHQEVAIQLGEGEDTKAATAEAAERQAAWWVDDAGTDTDLRAAVTESKETAIGQFYIDVLQRLLAEQEKWFAEGCPGAPATAPTHANEPSKLHSPLQSPRSVYDVIREGEAAGRRDVVRLYTSELQALLAQHNMWLSTAIKRTARRQRSVQEQIMLQCHQNGALKQRNVRVAAQLEKLRANGKSEEEAKRAQLAQLEARAAQLLTRLS